MKNLLLFIIMTGLLVSGCSGKKCSEPKIDYKGSAYVKFLASNVIDSINIETVFWSYFPGNNREIKRNIKILKDDNYYMEIDMILPALVEFSINKDEFTTYLIPGDTLEVKLKQEFVNLNRSITSYYIDDKIFNYYQKKFREFGYYMIIDNHGPLRMRWFLKMIATQKQLDTQIAEADSVQNRSISFLEDNSKDLPEWFIEMERNNIKYSIANCKLLFWGSLTNFSMKVDQTVNVPIYNPEAHLSFEYYRFINNYYFHGYPLENNITGTQRFITILNKEYPRIDSSLQGAIKSFFIIGYLAELYSGSKSDIEASNVDLFIKSHNLNLSPEGLKYLDNEKEIALNKRFDLASLKPGDSAPGFDLKDITGKNHKLSDFKGKIIYLHFWATWCGPCLGELPVLNKLITDVKSNSIVFINICLDNDYTKWESIIKEKKLLGINLICDDNWSKNLNSLYKISAIPHYTLIDKNGLVIKNNCVRPGNITTEISQLLGKK
jgi:thiol-disulfide isomerase/thioredoxin